MKTKLKKKKIDLRFGYELFKCLSLGKMKIVVKKL